MIKGSGKTTGMMNAAIAIRLLFEERIRAQRHDEGSGRQAGHFKLADDSDDWAEDCARHTNSARRREREKGWIFGAEIVQVSEFVWRHDSNSLPGEETFA